MCLNMPQVADVKPDEPAELCLSRQRHTIQATAHRIEGLNSRAQKQQLLNDVDGFAIDKYGTVQDASVQKQI
jgi:hypothetical protein